MALGARMVAKVPPLEGEKEGTCFEKSSYVVLHSIYLEHYELFTYMQCRQSQVEVVMALPCTLRPVSKLVHS